MNKADRIKSLIIASIIYEPKILLIDDLNDDDVYIMDILRIIIREFNITVLFTTTRLHMCRYCDNILFLNKGVIELNGDFDYICGYDNVLSRNGIVISPMLDLSLKLRDYNILNDIVLDSSRMVDKLWK